MLKIVNTVLVTLTVASSLHASYFVSDNFENNDKLLFQSYSYAQLSSVQPLSGKQHLLAQRQHFSATIPLAELNSGLSKIIVSCHVDPRGKETVLEFSSGNSTVAVHVDHRMAGYRQVIAELSPGSTSDRTVHVKSHGEAGTFILDDLHVSLSSAQLCARPEATQILANLNGESKDLIASFKIDGKTIIGSEVVSADGYLLMSEVQRVDNTVLAFGFQPEDEGFDYAYAIWADLDRNGAFSTDERVALTFAEGATQVPLELSELNNGSLALRIRMLDPRSHDMKDAYSGNTWGQSIDLFLELNKDPNVVPCRCEQPDYYLDLSGKKLNSLEGVPAGMYIKVNENCTEKTIVAW